MAQAQTENSITTGRRSTPPFRADHVGSLLRPPELLQAREEFAAGRLTAEQLRAIEDEAIRAVAMQRAAGLLRPPTGSSAAPPGTWTSSTSSAESSERSR